jgi:iron complex transport system substrate-binding protein
MRVVSVLPSATEIVCALGHESELVGRSAECDYPASVRRLPVVMRPKTFDADRPSAEIDRRVQDVRGRHESLYELDVDLLRRLEPDLILTQDLCGVCSVTDAEVAAACARADVAPRIVSLTPRSLGQVWESVFAVGAALDDGPVGRQLAARLWERTRAGPRPSSPARVAVVEWLDPPILAGLWAAEMVRAAGAQSLGPARGRPGDRTDWASIGASAPDLIVLSPCSFSVDRTRRELAAESLRAAISELRPPRGIYLADEAYFSRPGPRLADGVDLLRHLLGGTEWTPPMPYAPLAADPSEVPA